MKRPGLAIAVLASLVITPVVALAQIAPDDLVVTGAAGGFGWDTEIELADSDHGTGVSGSISVPNSIAAPCPGPYCPQPFTIPPKGTVRLRLSEIIPWRGPLTFRVDTVTEQPLPIVRARVFKVDNPNLSAELPVFRNPTLQPRHIPVLVYPGLRRQPGLYSNLILQALYSNAETEALVEAFDSSGHLLGSEVVTLPPETSGPFVLMDVAGHFGVSEIESGQVRVTSSADQTVWGVLATVYAVDGRLAVIPGVNP